MDALITNHQTLEREQGAPDDESRPEPPPILASPYSTTTPPPAPPAPVVELEPPYDPDAAPSHTPMPKAYGSTNSFNESLPDSLDLHAQDHGTMGSKGIQNISIEQIFNDATNVNRTTDAPLRDDLTQHLLTNHEITRTLKVY